MNTRRRLLRSLGAVALVAALPLRAQQPGRVYRIGSVYVAAEATTRPYEDSFLAGMRELGFEVGKNLVYDTRHCDGDFNRVAAAVDEVIALKPDLLVGIEQVASIMKNKTSTIPIVLSYSTDPVAAGLVKSLRQPGTNVTGVANLAEATGAKQVELFGELLPRMKKMALILDPTVPGASNIEQHIRVAARARKAELVVYPVRDRSALEQAFAAMERKRPDAVLIGGGSGMLFGNGRFMAESALRLKVPIAGGGKEQVEVGGLFGYSSSLSHGFRRAALPAARILKGANPANLPVEQPTEFELAINFKTAKALGIKVPQSILVRADRVIE
jgi:putative ABC transport system substrate-binding protein